MTEQNTDSRRIVVALDFAEAAAARALLARLDPGQCRVKIGKELFTAAGPDFVKEVVGQGFDVFLDLKFHDIPNTVGKAVAAACELGVWMVNVHASGGSAMMRAARAAVEAASHRPLLIAVTVLTSMSREDLAETGLVLDPVDQVRRLAALAQDSGMDGVVCSAAEAEMLRSQLGQQFVLVTPGIRDASDASGDQKRIVTPEDAIRAGSSYLVIGRPITGAADPGARLHEIFSRLHGAFPDLC